MPSPNAEVVPNDLGESVAVTSPEQSNHSHMILIALADACHRSPRQCAAAQTRQSSFAERFDLARKQFVAAGSIEKVVEPSVQRAQDVQIGGRHLRLEFAYNLGQFIDGFFRNALCSEPRRRSFKNDTRLDQILAFALAETNDPKSAIGDLLDKAPRLEIEQRHANVEPIRGVACFDISLLEPFSRTKMPSEQIGFDSRDQRRSGFWIDFGSHDEGQYQSDV